MRINSEQLCEGVFVEELPDRGGIRFYISPDKLIDLPPEAVINLVRFLEGMVVP